MRLSVTPGLTCIWQVSGRSNISFEGQMRLDNDYIRRDGKLGEDFKLILKTFKVVFKGKGSTMRAAFRYVILAIVIMLASGFLVSTLHGLVPASPEVLVKIPVDCLLFLLSFYIQREIVYK